MDVVRAVCKRCRSFCCSVMVLGVIVAVVTFITLPASVSAEERSRHIQLSPASVELSIDPGASASARATVSNQGSGNFRVKAYAAPYSVKGVDYTPNFTRLDGTTDASEWIKLHTGEAALSQGQVKDFEYTITVPSATKPGGYYAVVFAEASSETSSNQGVSASSRVGQVIYIKVNGEVLVQGSVAIDPLPLVVWGDTVTASAFVKNTGGIHFEGVVNTKVKNIFGTVVYENSEKRYVLPQTERKFSTDWRSGVLAGMYTVEQSAVAPDGATNLSVSRVIVLQPAFAISVGVSVLLITGLLVWKKVSLKRKR